MNDMDDEMKAAGFDGDHADALAEAVAAEREACARVAEAEALRRPGDQAPEACHAIADAIRARGAKP